MAKENSFDIVSNTDMAEVNNAINQTMKELLQRFDFKGSKSDIKVEEHDLIVTSDDEFKIKSVNDFTAEEVEIEIKSPSGVSADQLVDALYAFTDCEVTINSRIVVIRENRPVEMTVSDVLRENTTQLVEILKRELQLKEAKLLDELHFRTLERIFIEERIYKKIEQCKTNEAVLEAVHEGFKSFRKQLLIGQHDDGARNVQLLGQFARRG